MQRPRRAQARRRPQRAMIDAEARTCVHAAAASRRHTQTAGAACPVAAGGSAAGGATGGDDGAEVQVGFDDGDIQGKWTRHTHPPARVW